jgi:transposase
MVLIPYMDTKLRFKALPSVQSSLFPEDIFGRIAEDHPVRLVNRVVDDLDISCLLSQYKGGGASSFHPRMMLKVLFYSYLSNIYSCRKIEKALGENIHFMWLSGNSLPDFRTINYFRGKRLRSEIHHLFSQIVRLLVELGYVSLDVQYIDGTKIESAAGRYTFVWRKSIEKNQSKLQTKINSILADIDSQIKDDDPGYLPTESICIDSDLLKKKLSEINVRLKDRNKATQKALDVLQQEHLPRLEGYENQLKVLGDRSSCSKTDPDAVFMRMKDDHMKNGQLKPGYNTQISTEEQFITHYSIHQTTADTTTLESHLQSFEDTYKQQSSEVVADAGYGSEQNYELMEAKGIDAYVKYNYFHLEQKRKVKNNPFSVANLFYNDKEDFFVCPSGQRLLNTGTGKRISTNGYESTVTYYQGARCQGCPFRGQCHNANGNRKIEINHRLNLLKKQVKERLMSELGLAHRSKRPIEVEAVFAQMKANNKFTRFTLRGLEKVNIEFGLMAVAHNLRKMAVKQTKKQPLKTFFWNDGVQISILRIHTEQNGNVTIAA